MLARQPSGETGLSTTLSKQIIGRYCQLIRISWFGREQSPILRQLSRIETASGGSWLFYKFGLSVRWPIRVLEQTLSDQN